MGVRGLLSTLVPGLIALGLLLLGVVEGREQWVSVTDGTRMRDVQVLETVALTAAVFLAENDASALDTLIAQVTADGKESDLQLISVVSNDLRVLAHSDPELFNTRQDDPFTQAAVASAAPTWAFGRDELRVAVPAFAGVRWGTVTATYSLDRMLADVEAKRRRWLLALLVVAAAVLLLVSGVLTHTIVRPLRTLQAAARRMGQGDLDVRVPLLGNSELADLAGTLNQMAAALQGERQNLESTVAARTAELHAANEHLERLSVRDGLTGLFNHRRFQEALAHEVERCVRSGTQMSLLMIDVDHFKRLNDTLGHPAGDEVLRRIADRLSAALRTVDLCARYGGEEFAVVLPGTPSADARMVAERVRASVESTMNDVPGRPPVTVSVGVASWPADGPTGTDLLAAADKALYAAKHAGRNRVEAAPGATP
ncbi:MAG: diguanylate cyclase [Myxococcales bacterium]|nr:diguanylate cyclase [Myxococcales bacterium]